MADGTPGPWQTRFLYRMIRQVRKSPGDLLIATPEENDWADARLMAAAPDLLEALKAVVAIADRKTDEFDRARAAIAKATRDT